MNARAPNLLTVLGLLLAAVPPVQASLGGPGLAGDGLVAPTASSTTVNDTISTGVDLVQQIVHDNVRFVAQHIPSAGGVTVTNGTGLDNDDDGRPDYYYVRVQNDTAVTCWILQSDAVWDGYTATGKGNNYTPFEEDLSGNPQLGNSQLKLTLMVYHPSLGTNAAGCPEATPQLQPLRRVTGHAFVRLDPNLHLASEANPTRIEVYNDMDVKQGQVEVFARTVGTKNLGTHVVLRIFNPSEFDPAGAVSTVFMQPFDLSNVHLVSGYNVGPPPSPPQGLIIRHDFDDDDFSDIVEVSTPTTTLGKVVNPLNAKSTPLDWDGDNIPNAQDPQPTTPGLGWVILVTAPTTPSTQSGNISINWTATKAFAGAANLTGFDVEVTKFDNAGITLFTKALGSAAGCAATCSRTFNWDSHSTRFDGTNPTTDGRYRARVVATDENDAQPNNQTAKFDLKNFGWTVTVDKPAANDKLNGTTLVEWTMAPAAGVVHPLPIDHFDITLRREHAHPNNAHGNLHEWTIDSAVPGINRTFNWNTVRSRLDHPAADQEGILDHQDYKVQVKALDAAAGSGPQAVIGKSDIFGLNNTPAPTLSNLDIADANGFVDDTGVISGAANITFSVKAGRTTNNLPVDITRAAKVQFFRCPRPAANAGNGDLVGTFWTPVDIGANVLTVPADSMRAMYQSDGRRPNCPDNAGAPMLAPEANDGQARIVTQIFEHQNYTAEPAPRTLNASTSAVAESARKDFLVFNNVLPEVPSEALRANQTDVGGLTTTNTVRNDQAKFVARVVDPGAECVGATAPSSVRLRVTNATSGALVHNVSMERSSTEFQILGHVQSCPTDVPPWNSNLTLGVIYQATVPLENGSYVWNVTVVDKFGNQADGPNPAVASDTQAFLMGGPFGTQDVNRIINETLNELNNQIGNATNTLEGLLGCDLPTDGPDSTGNLPGCLVDNATGAYREVRDAVETLLGCDLDDDGVPATRECEDVVPTLTQMINENLTTLHSSTGQGLPNVWGLIFGCDNQITCPGDTDLDGFKDAIEMNAGIDTDPFNPYSNPLDADADLILNAIEGTVLAVHLYRIDWLRKAASGGDPAMTVPCDGTDDHAQDCAGKLVVLASPTKHVTVREPTNPGGPGYWLRLEESPGNTSRMSTTLGGGFSWTTVDGLLDVKVGNRSVAVRLNWSDGQRAAEVVVDFDKLGQSNQAFLVAKVLGGEPKPSGPGGSQVNTVNQNAQTVEVFTNPLDVRRNGESVYETVYNLNQTLKTPAAPAACPAGNDTFGTGTWARADRQANNSWQVCSQANGQRLPDVYTPANALPVGGVFFDEGGMPVPWVDANGNGQYDSGEELACPGGQAPQACLEDKAKTFAGCPAGDSLADCADRKAKEAIGGCTEAETAAECLERKGKEAAGCQAGETPQQCVERKAKDAAGCPQSDTLQQCVDRKAKEAIGGCQPGETATDCLVRKASTLATDFDGDGHSNQAELTAGSNPFYKYSTPNDKGLGFPLDWDADSDSNHKELNPPPGGQRSNPFQRCSTTSNPNGWSVGNPTHSCES